MHHFCFPTALEMRYDSLLRQIHGGMVCAMGQGHSFFDMPLCNEAIEGYLRQKGYELAEVRYDHQVFDGKKFYGFFGRVTGGGDCLKRVSCSGKIHLDLCFYGDYRR